MAGDARALAPVFAALGDPTRLELLERLSAGPMPMGQLAEGLPFTRQAVAKHVKVLESAGLVTLDREGRITRAAVRPEALGPARAYLEEVGALWEDALARLKDHLS